MWSRVVEIMLGCSLGLVISPFVFRHAPKQRAMWINDLAAGTAVILFGLLSYWRPTRRAHLLTLTVGIWLVCFAYSRAGGRHGDPRGAE